MESNHEAEKPSLLNRGKGLLKDLTFSFNSLLQKDEHKRKPNYAQQLENFNIKQQQQPDCSLQLKSADSQSLDSSTASQPSLNQSKTTFTPLQAKWGQSAVESRKSSMIHSYAAERAAPIQHAAHAQPNLHSSRSTTHSATQSTAPTSAVQTPQQQSPKRSIAVFNSSSRQFELGGDSAPLNSSAAGCLDAARRRMSANDALQNTSALSQNNTEPNDRLSEQRLYTPQFDNRRLLQAAASQMNQANNRQEQIKSASQQSAIIHQAPVRHVVVNEAIPNASEFNLAGLGSPKNTTNTLLAHIYEKRSDFPTELDPSLDPREPTPVPLPLAHPFNKHINQLILRHEQRTGGYKAQIQD